jgi:hypothetical protein
MKKVFSVILRIILCFVAVFLLFWFKLPALNIQSRDLWSFVVESIIICIVIFAISSIISFFRTAQGKKGREIAIDGKSLLKNSAKPVKILLVVIVLLIVVPFALDAVGAKIFNAKAYSSLLTMTDGDFSKDVAEIKMSQIPCRRFY